MQATTHRRSLPHRPHRGAILTLLAMLGFAAMDAMSKLLVRDYPITQSLWIRYAVFTLFALAIARRYGVGRALGSNRPALQAGRALLGLLENAVFVLAFFYLPLADTHAVAATSPLLVIALAVPLLGERAGLNRWLAVASGFAGVLIILRPGIHALSWPHMLPLLGALLWALYQVLTRLTARSDPPETTLLWTALCGFLGTSLLVPWQWHAPDTTGWLLLAGAATLGTLSHVAMIRALDFAPAGAVQPYSYSLLVWAALLGALVFGDLPDPWTIAGAAIVVLSGLYSWYQDRASASPLPLSPRASLPSPDATTASSPPTERTHS
ncbi:MAG: DMT family transporter [Acetobacteraceae bacterium]|nr:DMT family transporter [Acetobacteraceae bacterium]